MWAADSFENFDQLISQPVLVVFHPNIKSILFEHWLGILQDLLPACVKIFPGRHFVKCLVTPATQTCYPQTRYAHLLCRRGDFRKIIGVLQCSCADGKLHEHLFLFEFLAEAPKIFGFVGGQLRKIHLATIASERVAEVDVFFSRERMYRTRDALTLPSLSQTDWKRCVSNAVTFSYAFIYSF